MAKILVVDDSEPMRGLIRTFLEKNGYQIIAEAADGKAAVEIYCKLYLVDQFRPDLIMMDIVMPGMDGLEALKRIIEIDPRARILMVSAMDQETMIRESLQSGAAGFVTKPFSLKILSQAVDSVLRKSDEPASRRVFKASTI